MDLKHLLNNSTINYLVDAVNPGNMGWDTSKDIGESLSASNTPGNGTNNSATNNQWATGVSHAHALSGLGEGADGAVVNQLSVDDVVAGSAVRVGQSLNVQELQLGSGSSRILKR